MAKRLGYCIPCGEAGRYVQATVVIDDGQMCDTCMRMAKQEEARLLAAEPVPPEEAMAKADAATKATVAAAAAVPSCARCGAPRHRGLCKGRNRHIAAGERSAKAAAIVDQMVSKIAAPVPQVALQSRKERGTHMDRLVAEIVPMDQVPSGATQPRHPQGRSGELWTMFERLPAGQSIKVQCRDAVHVATTDRQLRVKAKSVGIAVGSLRFGANYYCWKAEA